MINYTSHRVKGRCLVSRTYRAALAAAATLAVLASGTSAHAGPEHDAAEMSQTVEVAWFMPGPFQGWATFPQTYLPGGVPACGDGAVQVDVYKYGTQEMRDLVDALLAGGVLTSPEDDSRIAAGNASGRIFRFVKLEPCQPVDPGKPLDPQDPGDPAPPDDVHDRRPPTHAPRALPARPHILVPTYAG